jgi:riboflavin synthase
VFTGIVEKSVNVVAVVDGPMFRRITLAVDCPDLADGQSVAVNGVCLTVAERTAAGAGFDVIQETLDKTNLGLLNPGDLVHVERSLRMSDRIDGHFVQGHVDGRAPLVDRLATDNEWRLSIRAPRQLVKYITPKGSVAVDGVSLTVAALKDDVFEVALIPTTLKLTALGRREIGWPFNLEADMVAKTIVSWLERREGNT